MVKRKRIGLIFFVNPKWMGGVYYILNLINSLNYLTDYEKPEIILLCKEKSDYNYALKYTSYPYLSFLIYYRKLTIFQRFINKLSRQILKKNIFSITNTNIDVDLIFPIRDTKNIVNGPLNIGWIPDFQDKYLTGFFSETELKKRDKCVRGLRDSGIPIVFSSKDAQNDFLKFYNGKIEQTHIYRFSSKIPCITIDYNAILHKYHVEENNYFLCSNQFWVHKNHEILFKAIKILKNKGVKIRLICTGNNNDFRSKDYYRNLLDYLEDNNLNDCIKILGLIERQEQLVLMERCRAIIQPSLFEGWNTSIEEAKSMNKLMILSDLNVHKEQAKDNALFFARHDYEELADVIESVINKQPKIININYVDTIITSARAFISLIK